MDRFDEEAHALLLRISSGGTRTEIVPKLAAALRAAERRGAKRVVRHIEADAHEREMSCGDVCDYLDALDLDAVLAGDADGR